MTTMKRDPDAARWLATDEPAPPDDKFWSSVEMSLRTEANTGPGTGRRPARLLMAAAAAAMIVAVGASVWFISDRDPSGSDVADAPVEVFGEESTTPGVADGTDADDVRESVDVGPTEDATDEHPADEIAIVDTLPCLHEARLVDEPTGTGTVCLQPGNAPDGLFATARVGAGDIVTLDIGPGNQRVNYRAIPVFDVPGGEPRMLDYEFLDGSLLSETYAGGFGLPATSPLSGKPLVLRVLELDVGGHWLRVQSPSRPKHRSMWVRAHDFDLGQTARRVEVDVADNTLRLYEGDEVLLDVSVVSGRDDRPTTLHQAWVEDVVDGFTEAYGPKVLLVATWSDAIVTFSNRLPRQLIHGTNTPELIGQRVTGGSIRVENDAIEQLARLATPGTPVFFFDSRDRDTDLAAISEIAISEPATTVPFAPALPGVLWIGESQNESISLPTEVAATEVEGVPMCPQLHPHLLPDGTNGPRCLASGDAQPGLFATGHLIEWDDPVVLPVFDEPGGAPRMLVHEFLDGSTIPHPVVNPSFFGNQPTLRVLELDPTGQWLRVQAPTRTNERSVWVRAQDFVLGRTTMRLEADVGENILRVFDGEVVVVEVPMGSGRDDRPTPLGHGWIRGSIPGPNEFFGPVVFALGTYSNSISMFSGGLPELSLHGPARPGYSTSGGLRVENPVMEQLAALVPLGTPVVIYDSRTAETDRNAIVATTIEQPAVTTALELVEQVGIDVPLAPGFV